MAKARDIKNRIKSVSNTKKITRTMELVATAKAKQAGDRIQKALPYFAALNEIAAEARGQGGSSDNPLLEEREIKRVAVLVIVGNRGLCGGYNTSVLRLLRDHVAELRRQGIEAQVIPSGAKAFSWLRYQGVDFDKDGYRQFEDKPGYAETEVVSDRLIKLFLTGEVDRVDLCYTHYYSAGRQGPTLSTLLPLSPESDAAEASDDEPAEAVRETDYIIEPDPDSILGAIFPLQVKLDVYQAYLSAGASEQIARRIAMKNANENAEELGRTLRMQYNRLRQTQITTEILEIIGGAEALK